MTTDIGNGHIGDDLPRLLTGDAGQHEVLAAAEHLRVCPDCQQELVAAVVAHASLTSAHRFAPEVVAPPPARDSVRLPSVIRLHNAGDSVEPGPVGEPSSGLRAVEPTQEVAPGSALPDLSAVFDLARSEAARTVRPARTNTDADTISDIAGDARRPGRTRRSLIAVAAAAVVLAGGGVAVGYGLDGSSTPTGHSVALQPFDDGHVPASATVSGDTVHLDAAKLPSAGDNARYEVWLTNRARTRMYSIGFLGDSSTATFTVQRAQLDRFTNIEVSRQPDGKIDYSHVSVLRGSYRT